MVRQILLGGVLGGIALFLWLGLSWAVLPFHRAALNELSKSGMELVAMGALKDAGLSHGVYYSGEPHEGSAQAEIPFMVYLPHGYPPMTGVMLKGLLLSILAALMVTIVVSAARQPSFKARVALCFTVGGIVALAGPMTFGNFFFFPLEWVIPDVLDQLVGWTLAGLVIAAFTKPAFQQSITTS
jgi:hypothetical protein